MQKIQFSIILFINSVCCFSRDLLQPYEKEISPLGGRPSTRNDMSPTANLWKSTLLRDWILLNAERERTLQGKYNNNNINNVYTTPRKQDFQEESDHPRYFGSYRENVAGGNYFTRTAATDVEIIEPYIVAIREMRSPTATNKSMSKFTNEITMPKDIVENFSLPPQRKEPKKQDIEISVQTHKRIEEVKERIDSAATMATSAIEMKKINNNETESFLNALATPGNQVNEIISPLQSTLIKFIRWCNSFECLVSSDGDDYNDNDDDDDEDAVDGDDAFGNDVNEKNSTNDNDLRFGYGQKRIVAIINASSSPVEVQGHEGTSPKATQSTLMSASSASTARSQERTRGEEVAASLLTSVGTGRRIKRLKKKLSKFILPLLIAYKLKFLTLIPVLIGGLILLVGTTGLAGFFFALFTAVMSLKATAGSKSIIIKKI